jgi:outer membrane protein assembly factor BamB
MKKTIYLILLILGIANIVLAQTVEEKWSYSTNGLIKKSKPAIASDGTIYFGGTTDSLYAIDPVTHDLKWAFQAGDEVESDPLIIGDTIIYFGSRDDNFYAVGTDGTLKWSYLTGGDIRYSSPIAGSDGTIYVGSYDDKLYAFDPLARDTLWTYATGGNITTSAALSADNNTVYIGSDDDKLHAVSTSTGDSTWTFTCGNNVQGTPVVATDGTIYFGSDDKNFYAVNPDGTEKWKFLTGGSVDSKAAMGADGNLYVGVKDGKVYAFDPVAMDTLWTFTTGAFIYNDGTLSDDNQTLFIGSGDHSLYALSTLNGNMKWSYETGHQIFASPTIVDTVIYMASLDGNLYALAEKVVDCIVCNDFDIDLGDDLTIDEGNSVEIGVEPVEGVIYSWNTGESSSKITVSETGEYILTGSNDCESIIDTINIEVCLAFEIDLGEDQEINEGSSVEIGVEPVEGITYSWSSGETTSKITVDAAGDYILTGTSNCESITDTVTVTVITSVDQFSGSQIQVYPNPAAEKLFIKGLEGEFSTEIISISGAIVKQEDNSRELNISDLHSGLYMLRISLEDGVFVKPFTKE